MMLKNLVCSATLGVGLAIGAFALPPQESATQDMKDAGHATKKAATDTGKATKKTAKKTGQEAKKDTKKTTHKVAKETDKGANKVADKTKPE